MATNTQFSIAVHILASLGYKAEVESTSGEIASSVNACPSFVRRVLSKLAKAHLVKTTVGKTGCCTLARQAQSISLLDIYHAIEAPKPFAIHEYAAKSHCKVSCQIKTSMEKILSDTQKSMEASLKKVSLADVISDLKK